MKRKWKWKRMWTASMIVGLITVLGGCSQSPVRFAASESQKVAIDVTLKRANTLEMLFMTLTMPNELRVQALTWLTDLKKGAEAAKAYIGIAKNPIPTDPATLKLILDQAQFDAARRPTVEETLLLGADTVERTANAGLDIADRLWTFAAGIGALGIGGVGVNRFRKGRTTLTNLRERLNTTSTAFSEVVRGIDGIVDPKLKNIVLEAQEKRQSDKTEELVRIARHTTIVPPVQ